MGVAFGLRWRAGVSGRTRSAGFFGRVLSIHLLWRRGVPDVVTTVLGEPLGARSLKHTRQLARSGARQHTLIVRRGCSPRCC